MPGIVGSVLGLGDHFQYALTNWIGTFDLQLLSPRGSTQNCHSGSISEIHFVYFWDVKQPRNNLLETLPNLDSLASVERTSVLVFIRRLEFTKCTKTVLVLADTGTGVKLSPES